MTLSDYIKNHVMPILFEKFYGIPSCTDPSRILSMIPYVDYITMFDGSQFKVTKNLWCVLEESRSEYDWSDMRNTDTLLDIGAHVGTITIPAALTRVNKVIAVEPLFADELRENIRLNNLDKDYYKLLFDSLRSLSSNRLQGIAGKYFGEDSFVEVAVG